VVDQRGGPKGAGVIMQSGDLAGIASRIIRECTCTTRFSLRPARWAVAPEREWYLAYKLGPMIEDFGQIVIPTGVIEVTRRRAMVKRPRQSGETVSTRCRRGSS